MSGKGSPPRVWGKQFPVALQNQSVRFTPTCVGKTRITYHLSLLVTVHPHVCGENKQIIKIPATTTGSPPRVWGKLIQVRVRGMRSRFTPTCVGKTQHILEYMSAGCGSPPRVWGKQCFAHSSPLSYRFTPTCVGKTGWVRPTRGQCEVHPHVCGENV